MNLLYTFFNNYIGGHFFFVFYYNNKYNSYRSIKNSYKIFSYRLNENYSETKVEQL